MNYKEFQKARCPKIAEQSKKIEDEVRRLISNPDTHLEWGYEFATRSKDKEDWAYAKPVFFLPSFMFEWHKWLNSEARSFGVRLVEHQFIFRIKFIRSYFQVWVEFRKK
jgi:hypothetical protein